MSQKFSFNNVIVHHRILTKTLFRYMRLFQVPNGGFSLEKGLSTKHPRKWIVRSDREFSTTLGMFLEKCTVAINNA